MPVTAIPPEYPIAAIREGIEGMVLLRVLVDETGKPVQGLVLKSSGSRELDTAARDHVLAAWRFSILRNAAATLCRHGRRCR